MVLFTVMKVIAKQENRCFSNFREKSPTAEKITTKGHCLLCLLGVKREKNKTKEKAKKFQLRLQIQRLQSLKIDFLSRIMGSRATAFVLLFKTKNVYPPKKGED